MLAVLVKVKEALILSIFRSEKVQRHFSEPHISEQLTAACEKVSKKLFHFHGSQGSDAEAS
jgi:hypothetical protein